ncbi:MAG TPA: hypothetical protein VF348_11510 [Usitatibacter sp.]
MAESIMEAWTALMGELEARKRELGEAVRAYPTPIARCDDQLPKAIAQRDAAAMLVRSAAEVEGSRGELPMGQWRERVRDFAQRLGAADDDGAFEASLGRLLAALEAR